MAHALPGQTAKRRHQKTGNKAIDWSIPAPREHVARAMLPVTQNKSKHYSYFELVPNEQRMKKKLELQVTFFCRPLSRWH